MACHQGHRKGGPLVGPDFLLFVVSLAVPGCLIPPDPSILDRPLSKDAICLDLPFRRQSNPKLCGVSCLEILLNYYDFPLGESEVKEIDQISRVGEKENGIRAALLKTFLENRGWKVYVFSGDLSPEPHETVTNIQYHLGKGRPLIVMIARDPGRENHYVVVGGMDEAQRAIVIMDPLSGYVLMRVQPFLAAWERCERFTLLAVPETVPANGEE
ncbi:MAG: cysteine peptidase family C39 domain-containing protein [Planctomycetota bacterium]|jgi:ABC-type bacteriocin/lantibiotic exporter with double-glycine peptidase domain